MTIRARGALSLVASAIALLTVGATAALADDQYGGVAGQSTGGGSSSGTLPFTGADLLLYAVVGLAIVASGLVLRRVAAGRSKA